MLKTVIFVTGTDTDIGKTFVSNLLVHKWKANYWKPVQTGVESDEGDTTTIQTNKLTNWDPTLFIPRYSLQKPLSPYQAMEFEPDTQIELNDFILPKFLDNTPLVV
ncbi:dethiobiotin synthase SCDLUD_003788 [Saccharomycodes ludwigii]|nr:hypothetical protein SCDLUD_003788 [Saccharomycodes ludwigii]KAH3900782.1 hypothetical protein SCDLUD_003788 [Saccharomycodes ludwigii]